MEKLIEEANRRGSGGIGHSVRNCTCAFLVYFIVYCVFFTSFLNFMYWRNGSRLFFILWSKHLRIELLFISGAVSIGFLFLILMCYLY